MTLAAPHIEPSVPVRDRRSADGLGFRRQLRPLYPQAVDRLTFRKPPPPASEPADNMTSRTADIRIKRVYDPPDKADGTRVLVDRLWPHGLRKEKAAARRRLEEIAASAQWREGFGRDPWSTVCDRLGGADPIVLAGIGGVGRSKLVAGATRSAGFGPPGMARGPGTVIRSEGDALRARNVQRFGVNRIRAATDHAPLDSTDDNQGTDVQ